MKKTFSALSPQSIALRPSTTYVAPEEPRTEHPPVPVSSSTRLDLRTDVPADVVAAELRRANSAIEASAEATAAAQSELSKTRAELASTRRELTELTQKFAQLGSDNKRLQQRLQREQEIAASNEAERQQLRTQVRAAESASAATLRALHAVEARAKETVAEAQRTLEAELELHVARAVRQAQHGSEERAASARAQLDEARQEARACAAEAERRAHQLLVSHATIRRLQGELAVEAAARQQVEEQLEAQRRAGYSARRAGQTYEPRVQDESLYAADARGVEMASREATPSAAGRSRPAGRAEPFASVLEAAQARLSSWRPPAPLVAETRGDERREAARGLAA